MKNVDNYYEDTELAQMQPSRISWTPHQLYQAFPKSAAHAKNKRKALISEVLRIQDEPRTSHRNAQVEWSMNFILIDGPIAERMAHVAYLDRYIALCASRAIAGDDGVNIARAKAVPITQFVEVNRAGFASCLKHDERTGSMKVYPKDNRFHCFSCGWDGTVIDVVMQIDGCSFIEAVKRLGV